MHGMTFWDFYLQNSFTCQELSALTKKKNSKPCTMLCMKRKLSLYFQPSSPALFSISIFHQFHFPSVHSFTHPSICSHNFHFWNCTYQHIVLTFKLTAKLFAARTKFRKSIIRNTLFKPLHGHISHTPDI